MADITTTTTGRRNRSFSKSKQQLSTRVDLTPMVDLGFLLLTFFVFTSALSEPKVMTIIQPADGIKTPVPQSGAMTILLGKDHRVYYYYGILNEKAGSAQIKRTNFKDIRSIIVDKKQTTAAADLMYVIKADQNSTFGDSIDLLDEMAICDIKNGCYAEIDISSVESDIINSMP